MLFSNSVTPHCVPAARSPLSRSSASSPEFRRSHGSLYKGLVRGHLDEKRFRDLVVEHRPRSWPEIFAVDASTWDRCDAECSPSGAFTTRASKHLAGQPIVAGWSYQWIAQLDFASDSSDRAPRRPAHPPRPRPHGRHHRNRSN